MFELKYEPIEEDWGWIHIIVNGMDISKYSYRNNIFYGRCRIKELVNWLKENLKYILSIDDFPVRTENGSGVDMWLNSDLYIPNDLEESLNFQEKRQNWLWCHAIDTCQQEFCMPFVVFRNVGNGIEISWNNLHHFYDGVEFLYTKGSYIADIYEFTLTVNKFMEQYT